jgi:hypothetical protein
LPRLEDFAGAMPAPDRPGVETLIERLRAEQAARNEALVPFVDAGQLAALSELVSELVATAEELGTLRREGEARQEARPRRAPCGQCGSHHQRPA